MKITLINLKPSLINNCLNLRLNYMIDFSEDLNYHKREKNKIKSEINDLQSRIFVERGRNNRLEVNHYRNRINRLKLKLTEINQKIVELENE